MIYTNIEIISINTNFVTVQISGQDIIIFLPSVISRMPVVGDRVVCNKDNSDTNGFFVCYMDEQPTIPTSDNHIHQLLSDDIISSMTISASQKAEMRTKRTGGVK